MGRLQTIENALVAINPAVFQELCDSILILRNKNYSAFVRSGSQSGKQKTTKGTPDTFFLLPNGKFLFIEYSTNITKGVKKLKKDIKACLDSKKTKIPINQLDEIILCLNFNLKPDEVKSLGDLLINTRIRLTIYSLDELSILLHLHHRDLAYTYLGLSFDTGQILSKEQFITEYNKFAIGLSTPIDNPFLHREKELKEVKKLIIENDFVILTGAPGVGKTKLALKAISEYIDENPNYTSYCISNKHANLNDDLHQYFKPEHDYILFVDDANRLDAFNQIVSFYRTIRKGTLKILITVRDYAYQEVSVLCYDFLPKRFDVSKFSDQQISDILESKPYLIHKDHHSLIHSIAEGNPRLAIMAALLAKEHGNIYALRDVSHLFEKYFATFVKDGGAFSEKTNISYLGLIAFFYTIPYKDRKVTSELLANFNLDYNHFVDSIDKLEKLELVDIQFEHVKIPEQNLSTYYFYRAFIQDKLLDFQTLLTHYFERNRGRFFDCVIPANNLLGGMKVMESLRPALKKYWIEVSSDEEKAYEFLGVFWLYMRDETLEYFYSLVKNLPENNPTEYQVKYEQNDFSYRRNKVIEILGNYFTAPTQNLIKDSLEIAFEYVRKLPEHLPELIYQIRASLVFDKNDFSLGFLRQKTLFNIVIKGIEDGDKLLSTVFFELSKTFLKFSFQKTEGGRRQTVFFYTFTLPARPIVDTFRERIWSTLITFFHHFPSESLETLESYSRTGSNINKKVMENDLQYILNIIESKLTRNSFEHCLYVHHQIWWFKKNDILHPGFQVLEKEFTNQRYNTFKKIDWNTVRDKEVYDFKNYKEYENLKEKEIRESFVFKTSKDISQFYLDFIYLKSAAKNLWNFNNTLDLVVDENFVKNLKIGMEILSHIISENNKTGYVPKLIFHNQLRKKETAKAIWDLIDSDEFIHSKEWKIAYFKWLDESLVDLEESNNLIETIKSAKKLYLVHYDKFEKYLKFKPDLFGEMLKVIVENNEGEDNENKIQLWTNFFEEQFDNLGGDIELIKKAYLQQDKLQHHFDLGGKGFLKILEVDNSFLSDYINFLYTKHQHSISYENRDLDFVWEIPDIEDTLKSVFDTLIQKEIFFGIKDHFCNSFFSVQKEKHKDRQEKFIFDYCKENFKDVKKIRVIVDITRHSMKKLYEPLLLLFISLNQNVDDFSKIQWIGTGGVYSGNVIIGDINASKWRNVLTIIEKSKVGISLLPIKRYVMNRIEESYKEGDYERRRRFLERF